MKSQKKAKLPGRFEDLVAQMQQVTQNERTASGGGLGRHRLERIGVARYKIGSGEVTNLELISAAAEVAPAPRQIFPIV